MGVQIPGFRLQSQPDLPELRRRIKGMGRRKEIVTDITLTSLIDVFSVVILFLLQSFSTTGEIMIINPALSLPQAYHGVELTRSPIVTILPNKVTVEGLDVGNNKNLNEKIEETDWELPLLSQKLQSYRDFVKGIYPDAPFPGEVIIQADAGLDFIYLKRVLFTLTKIGFTNINLAVRGEASKAIGNALKPTSSLFKGANSAVGSGVKKAIRRVERAGKASTSDVDTSPDVYDDVQKQIDSESGQ